MHAEAVKRVIRQAVACQFHFEHRVDLANQTEYFPDFKMEDIDRVYAIEPESVKFRVRGDFHVEINGDIKHPLGYGFLFATDNFWVFNQVTSKKSSPPSLMWICGAKLKSEMDAFLPLILSQLVRAQRIHDPPLIIPRTRGKICE